MQTLIHDVRYAFRQMRKSPVFSATAIVVLSLGVCASVAIFAFVDAALLKPLPYPDSSRLVDVTESAAMFPRANLSYLDYLDWKKLNHSFRSLEVYNNGASYLLRTATGAEPITGMRVSAGFFRTLQVAPALGRDFFDGEDQPSAAKTVILTYSSWQKRYGGRKDVIGQTILLSDVAHTIVGVLPQSFQFAPAGDSELWAPYHQDDQCAKQRGCHNLYGVARLKDGVSIEAARAEMTGIARQLELEYPVDNLGQSASVEPLSKVMVADVRPILLLLLGGAGLLLVIACANVSSLLLVRSESRKREIAVRGALGASRPRLIRQFVTEGFVLMAGGTILGLMAASGAMRILLHLISKDLLANMPYLNGIGINLHVFLFALLVGMLAASLFSLAPIMRLPLSKVREGLAEGGRSYAGTLWRRFGANLVVVELAVAVVLLFGAGLLGKSFYRLLHVDVGFQADHLATVTLNLSDAKYSKDEQIVPMVRQILQRTGSLPGVQSVGLSTMLPVSFNGNTNWIRVVGHPYNGEHNEVNTRSVTPDFFSTLHAKLLRGRYFTEADDASKPPVIMINQKLASTYLPGEDPIGKRIGDNQLSPKSIAEIVGVVEDVKDGSLDTETWPAMYHPFNQSTDTYFSLVARTSQSEQSVLPALMATIREVDPGIGTLNPTSMAARINESPSAYLHRSAAWLVGGFAFLALLLGVVGLYGVIAYSVSQRTREIGVRMALGAQRESVLQLIMKEAGGLAAAGIVVGLVCAVGAATLMRALLFGVQTWDVATLAGVAILLASSAMSASYLPARRAASVNPIEALRYE
jgi:macrolide transport system ATP-binding/permease protein